MDSNDLEKIRLEHKLHVRRIILDKVLIGVVILIIGAVANYTLERYKSKETERRYRLTEQYKAALSVYEKAGALFTYYSQYSDDHVDAAQFKITHKAHIASFAKSVNEVDFLFSHQFTDINQLVLHVHLGLVDDRIPDSERKDFHSLSILLFEIYKEKLAEEIGVDRDQKYTYIETIEMSPEDNPAEFLKKLRTLWISKTP